MQAAGTAMQKQQQRCARNGRRSAGTRCAATGAANGGNGKKLGEGVAAVLQDAIRSFCECSGSRGVRSRKLYDETSQWFASRHYNSTTVANLGVITVTADRAATGRT